MNKSKFKTLIHRILSITYVNYTNKSKPLSSLSAIVLFYDCPCLAPTFQSVQDSDTLLRCNFKCMNYKKKKTNPDEKNLVIKLHNQVT